jgi:hypothetical protein
MTTLDRPEEDPVRLLLELFAMQADALAASLDRIYDEAYLGTASDGAVQRLDDGSLRIEFGDGARGRRPPLKDRRLVATYRRGSGEVTLAYLPAAPARPPAASDPSPRDAAARGRRSAAQRPRRPPR